MNRWANDRDQPSSGEIRAMYHKALANWAFDLIHTQPRLQWPKGDPADDYRDRDWASLYAGSVLDD